MPSARACHVSRPSRRDLPLDWTAKSTIVVVPPNAAARVPVSKSSLANVPPKGSFMWVWTSMPPGITHLPLASMRSSAVARSPMPRPISSIVSPSIRMSASYDPSAVTIVPPVMRVRITAPAQPRSPGQDPEEHCADGRPVRAAVSEVATLFLGRGVLGLRAALWLLRGLGLLVHDVPPLPAHNRPSERPVLRCERSYRAAPVGWSPSSAAEHAHDQGGHRRDVDPRQDRLDAAKAAAPPLGLRGGTLEVPERIVLGARAAGRHRSDLHLGWARELGAPRGLGG